MLQLTQNQNDMKKNKTTKSGVDVKTVMNVAVAAVAVAAVVFPSGIGVAAVTKDVPAWLRGHIFF